MPGQNLGGVCNCLSYVLGKRLADDSFEFPSGPIVRMSTAEEESIQNDGSMFAAMMGDSEGGYADGEYEGVGAGGMGGTTEGSFGVVIRSMVSSGRTWASVVSKPNHLPECTMAIVCD
jgi:hypothetical protein